MSEVRIQITHFSDPGCPWAYSASPAHAVLQWRYGPQLSWRLVLIGLRESAGGHSSSGYTTARQASGYLNFGRRFGMPFGRQPRERLVGTGPACRAVVATRRVAPDREIAVFRALQFAQFTTPGLFDTEDGIRDALTRVEGLDVEAILAERESAETVAAYEADRAEARTAAGSPTEFQGRSANTDGAVRFTAPSLKLATPDGRALEVGGFQPVEAYDVAIANLDPTLERRDPSDDPIAILEAFPDGLTSAEAAAIATPHLGETDLGATERAFIAAADEGAVRAEPLGDSTLWRLVD
ncbi:MAG: hypothetical protein JHC95_15585 [Solirubrobacteraceae bacterium]|nr:hypothetical protein [Solirubrobacteraceae bacterium]